MHEDEITYSIYKITNKINNKIYIGLTKFTIDERFNDHLKESKYSSEEKRFYFHRALIKYGKDNFIIEKIDETIGFNNAENLEIEYIAKFNSNNREVGYNSTTGGKGCPGRKRTDEEKLKMSEISKKNWEENEYIRTKLTEARIQYQQNNFHPMLGKKLSKEAKIKKSIKARLQINRKGGNKRAPGYNNKSFKQKPKLSPEQVEEAKKLFESGELVKTVTEKFNITSYGLRQIMSGTYINSSLIKPKKIKINTEFRYSETKIQSIINIIIQNKFTKHSECAKYLKIASSNWHQLIVRKNIKEKIDVLLKNNKDDVK